ASLVTNSMPLGDPMLDGMELEGAKKGETSGHNSILNNPQADSKEPNPVNEGNPEGVVIHEDLSYFGLWMLAKRKQKRNGQPKQGFDTVPARSQTKKSGSRFEVLV
ncbi:hypothetical protein S245_067207, partial [Arachis hypogaea]